ncbi:hypothetical protein BGW42_001213 [Actinomortierella wolfii]|nr:hypothetical protein BGW42_001213 [Actinomortierella wolfii]
MASASPSPGPRPPKQRLIRHRPFYQRWLQAPEDWYLRIENKIEALDWDLIQETISYPIVVALNALMISVTLGYWFDDPLSNVPTVLRNAHHGSSSSYRNQSLIPGFASLLAYLKTILIAISCLNTIWFLTSRRNYRMLQRSLHERPPTVNVRMVEIQQDSSHWSTRFPGWLFYPFYVLLFRKRPFRSQTIKVWEMSVWNPSILSRNIFCWFSPAQVLIMAAMDDSNFYMFAPLAAFLAAQDKQILFAEVYREYNQRFVHPRLFVQKFDKQVSAGTSYMMNSDDDEEEAVDSDYSDKDEQTASAAGRSHRSRHNHRDRHVPPYWPRRRQDEDKNDDDEEEEEEEEEDEQEEMDGAEDVDIKEDEGEDEDEEEGNGDYEEPKIPHPRNALAFSDDDDDT